MPKKAFEGMTALVTGAAKRIGRQIAIALAEEGANIVVHYRNSSGEAEELCSQLAAYHVLSWPVKADFDNPEEYETLIQRSVQMAGWVDILINGASIFSPATLKNLDFEGLTKSMRVNAWAPFVLIRDFVRTVGQGKIVNLLDTRIIGYDLSHAGYILSKHVLYLLTRMAAIEFAPHVTVNAVAPGLILPPPGKDEDYLNWLANRVPLKRHGKAGDIADAVIYLLKSDFVTGQVIYADGGRHLKELSPNGPNPD